MDISSLGPCAFQNKDKIIQSAVLQYLKSKGLEDSQLESIMKSISDTQSQEDKPKMPASLPNSSNESKMLESSNQFIKGGKDYPIKSYETQINLYLTPSSALVNKKSESQALRQLKLNTDVTPLSKIFSQFLNAPDTQTGKNVEKKLVFEQLTNLVGFDPSNTSLIKKLKNPLAKLSNVPGFTNLTKPQQQINLESHTKTFFDQFSRKKTVYCHINPESLREIEEPDDDAIDEANVYNVVYSGTDDSHIVSAGSDGLIKVFSRSTGILKKTLKGHLLEINILCKSIRKQRPGEVHTTGEKYLISGSENGHVRIWDTVNYNCLAVLNEFEKQEITSLIFWEGEELNRGFLMICSPTVGVCIYQEKDLIHNQGLSKRNQKCYNITSALLVANQKIEFYFAEISNDGYLAAYGSSGYIYIWPKINHMFPQQGNNSYTPIKVFKGLSTLTKKSMVYINWSPESDYLVNYNETTVSVSKFNQPNENLDSVIPLLDPETSLNSSKETQNFKKQPNPVYMHEHQFSVVHDKSFSQTLSIHHRRRVQKSSLVAVNDKFLVASFNLRSNSIQEETLLKCNLVFYNLQTKVRMHVITPENTGVNMETNTAGMSFHPIFDSIFATVDNMGQVVIWDVIKGQVLRVFLEKGVHLNYNLFEANVWDCYWSTKGDGIVVSTGLGTWSEYGYGSAQLGEDQLNYSEQFFLNDYEIVVLQPSDLCVKDLDGRDWYQNSETKEEGKKSVGKKFVRTFTRVNSKMEPVEGYCDEFLQQCSTRQDQIEYISNVPGVVTANRLVYQRQDVMMDRDEKMLLPKVKEQNVPVKVLLENMTKERFFDSPLGNVDAITGEVIFENIGTTARRREQHFMVGASNLEGPDDEEFFNDSASRENPRNARARRREEADSVIQTPMSSQSSDESDIDSSEERNQDEDNQRRSSRLRHQRQSHPQRAQRRTTLANLDDPYNARQPQRETRQSRNYARRDTQPYSRQDLLQRRPRAGYHQDYDNSDSDFERILLDDEPVPQRRMRGAEQGQHQVARRGRGRPPRNAHDANSSRQLTDNSMHQTENEGVCNKCLGINPEVKCSYDDCAVVYKEKCAVNRGRQTNQGFSCFECLRDLEAEKLLAQNNTVFIADYKKTELLETSENLSWISKDYYDYDMISPQKGDVYYFVNSCYEAFVANFFEMLSFGHGETIWPSNDVTELNRYQDGYLCKVVEVDYKWPLLRTKTQFNAMKPELTPFAILKLQSTSNPNLEFTVRYFPSEVYPFLVFHKYYECKMEMYKHTNNFSQIKYSDEVYHIEELNANADKSLYNCIKAKKVQDEGGQIKTRYREDESIEYFSPWQVEYTSSRKSRQRSIDSKSKTLKQLMPCMDLETREKLRQRLLDLWSIQPYFYEFLVEVNKDMYSNYNDFIPVEMNISRLVSRVIQGYYRSIEGLQGDIELIVKNCMVFNSEASAISEKANQIFPALAEHVKDFIENKDSLGSLSDTLEGMENVKIRISRGHYLKIAEDLRAKLEIAMEDAEEEGDFSRNNTINLTNTDIVSIDDESKKNSKIKPAKKRRALMDSDEDEDSDVNQLKKVEKKQDRSNRLMLRRNDPNSDRMQIVDVSHSSKQTPGHSTNYKIVDKIEFKEGSAVKRSKMGRHERQMKRSKLHSLGDEEDEDALMTTISNLKPKNVAEGGLKTRWSNQNNNKSSGHTQLMGVITRKSGQVVAPINASSGEDDDDSKTHSFEDEEEDEEDEFSQRIVERHRSRDYVKKKGKSESEEFDPEEECSDDFGDDDESFDEYETKRGRGRPPRDDGFVVEGSEERLAKRKKREKLSAQRSIGGAAKPRGRPKKSNKDYSEDDEDYRG